MGKKAKRRQRATMNEMNQMVQAQVDDYGGRRQVAQENLDLQRGRFEDFQITNPFAGAQNIYAGARNTYAG